MLNTVLRHDAYGVTYVVDLAPGKPSAGPPIVVSASQAASLNRVHKVSYIGSAPVTLTFPSGTAAGDRISVFTENIGMAPSAFSIVHLGSTLLSFAAPMFSQQYIRFEWSGSAWILS